VVPPAAAPTPAQPPPTKPDPLTVKAQDFIDQNPAYEGSLDIVKRFLQPDEGDTNLELVFSNGKFVLTGTNVEGNRFEESAGGQRAIAVPRGQVVTGPLESPSTTPSAGSGTSVGSQPDGKSNAQIANELKVKFGLDAQALIDAGSDPKAILDLLNGAPSAANLLGLRPLASLSNTVGSRAWQEQASDSELAANGYVRGADGKVSMTPEKVDEVRRALIDDPKFRVGVMGVLALPGQVSRGLVKSDEIADLVDQASLVVGSILAAGVKAEPIQIVGGRAPVNRTGGADARRLGEIREQAVADAVGGRISGELIKTANGKTDIDVIDAAGNIYAVGGAAKARDLGNFQRVLRVYSETAETRGVEAYFYYAPGTPQSVIDAAIKVLGPNFVKPIP
jgi:hypothetical protein